MPERVAFMTICQSFAGKLKGLKITGTNDELLHNMLRSVRFALLAAGVLEKLWKATSNLICGQRLFQPVRI